MRMSEDGDMWSVVFPKRMAVDVIVVKPVPRMKIYGQVKDPN